MALMTLLPPPSHTGAGAGAGGTTCTGVGGSVGGGGGGGGGTVVVVLVDVVEVVVLVVVDDVVDAATRRASVVVVARSALEPSSRPWKRRAEVDATTMATTTSAPITHPRVRNRPTPGGSAPGTPPLREGWSSVPPPGHGSASSQPFLGISRKGLPLLVSGSFGRPSTRSPRMFFWISSVPP